MTVRRLAAAALAALLLLGAVGCSTAPQHPALVEAAGSGALPPLLSLRRFVANVDDVGGFVLSPDGKRLVWQQTVGLDTGLAVRSVDGGAVTRLATGFLSRPNSAGPTYAWLPDSRHLAYLKDFSGNENTQLFVQDTQAGGAPWAVTPWPGVRSVYIGRSDSGSARFYFASNRRDKALMDLYEADADARTVREVMRAENGVDGWLMGADRKLAGRVRRLGNEDGADRVFELLQPDGTWRAFKTVGGFDSYWMSRIDRAAGKAWVITNIGRDKSVLVEADLASGAERVLASDEQVDLDGAMFAAGTGAPIGFVTEPGLPKMHWFDASLEREVNAAVQQAIVNKIIAADEVITRPQSFSEDNQRVVLRSTGHFDSAELLLDRATGQVTRLDPLDADAAALLVPQQPFSFSTSDGRTVHGYLIRPRGVKGPAPLVVDIHGGPWVRDHWSSAGFQSNTRQMLANRGYAVLLLNYRGSSGYGRDHLWAAERETYGKVQQDIAEGVQWAIDRKIADPARLAVLGGSFGGFSVLAQLIQQRHAYRCGIDIVGVANWPRTIENWPPFWHNRHYFRRTYGDVDKPEERAAMLVNSPISHLDKITAPLLVIQGANDVRVQRQDSDDVVASLRARGQPVEYLLFADEGHSIRKWRNRLAMWRRIEETLATCLGGRSAGFDFYELMPR